MKINLEMTDTFAGESNYAWVRREELDVPINSSALSIVRKAKAWAGLTGVPCRKEDFGDFIALYPRGICQVLFINF